MSSIATSVRLATPIVLANLGIEGENEQQAVHETVLQQVLVTSEKYICHSCVNRYSIVEGEQSEYFLELLTQLLEICPYSQPTMESVLHMPVILTIPSCLTFFENENSINNFVVLMIISQHEWNKTRGTQRQMCKTLHRVLRMEGIEDVIDTKLRNDKAVYGGGIVANSISWNNLLGMNLQKQE
ncbi:hypothetical protein BLNAU_25184 [Blattamonas nauphoetae]|nr:hypothetical protein BLNAU_25184 [Blattamonas nauphoetae]